MIRLPATSIVLSRVDLKDFDVRRQRLQATRAKIHAEDQDKCFDPGLVHFEERAHQRLAFPFRVQDQRVFQHPEAKLPAHFFSTTKPSMPEDGGHSDTYIQEETLQVSTVLGADSIADDLPEQEHGHLLIGLELCPEHSACESYPSSSPSKHDFYYGGFSESPGQHTTVSQGITPIRSDNTNTAQNIHTIEPRRLRVRLPLPRSPLFISQNLSSSPERRPTAGLTPRVASRVAMHNTPGIIFSQPARRPPRHPALAFRHQTNSFSFDSSERASAAYDQERVYSYSTTESFPRPSGNLNLHEELRDSWLRDTSSDSERSSFSPSTGSLGTSIVRQTESNQSIGFQEEFGFSSPQLPLPPPFSASSRNSSGLDILPSVKADILPSVKADTLLHPTTSPLRSSSSPPIRQNDRIGNYDQLEPVLASPQEPDGLATVPRRGMIDYDQQIRSPSGNSARGFFDRAARAISGYRSRTPSTHVSPTRNHPSLSASPALRQSHTSWPDPRSASSNYQIYDDSLPAHSQPQTPAHLPEARHQSRFHSSLTAPVARVITMSGQGPRQPQYYHQSNRRQLSLATPSRRGAVRSNSPAGLRTRGFEGLYGGRENGDEEQNWAEGVRFNNAGTRLWAPEHAADDGRAMRETPEPEEWRVVRGT